MRSLLSAKCRLAVVQPTVALLRRMATQLQQQQQPMTPPPAVQPTITMQQQGSLERLGLNAKHVTAHQTSATAEGFQVYTWAGGDERFWWGLASSQGRRPHMEDAHAVDLDLDGQHTALFGVFDGHAGREVAAYCARHIRDVVVSRPSFAAGRLDDVLSEAFLALEEDMKDPANKQELLCLRQGLPSRDMAQNPAVAADVETYGHQDQQSGEYRGPHAGATACVAMLRDSQLYVASVGDSRCVLSDSGKAVALTRDHKAKDPEEARRVTQAGLSIAGNRVCTEQSSLAMTRALGDAKYKQQHLPPQAQAVTPMPETTHMHVDTMAGAPAGAPESNADMGMADFLVIACDGLWDCMTNQQAVTFLQVAMEKGLSPQQAATALTEEALSAHSVTPATRDNITVLVVQFAPMPAHAA